MSFLKLSAILLLALLPAVPANAQVYKGATLVVPGLIADTTAIVPNQTFRIGLVLKMAPGWHTYWQYPGDAGGPTAIQWTLPPGFSAGAIDWPLPEATLQSDILTYTYSGEVMLMQTITPPADLKPGATIELKANVSWLVCAELCIPWKTNLTLTLPVADSAQPANAAEFDRWTKQLPSVEEPPFPVKWSRSGDQLLAKVAAPSGTTAVDFFPLPPNDDPVGHPQISGSAADGFTIGIQARSDLRGVLTATDADGRRGWLVIAAPGLQVAPTPDPSGSAPPARAPLTLFTALAFGFLGGIILNLMPCVLPVISLKIFGFVRQAGQSRRRVALHGLAFSGGIFAWFLGLGVVIVALKAAGMQPTWAFQYQYPWFNLAIATIVFVFALNLFGVFELTLPGRAATALSEAGSRDGYGGSFFQGAFATLLATPCTGPFLATSLAYAFSREAPVTLLLFASMAAGMSLPYLAISAQPGWVRFLPKPGTWMERLKQFMGFPLMAALLWLLYIIGAQKGSTAVIWAAAFLLTLGLALWLYGLAARPVVKPRPRAAGVFFSCLLALAGGWLFLGVLFANEHATSPSAAAKNDDGIPWVPYSRDAVDKLLAAGKPVFIDFTADWCLSCKFNERTAIDTAAVRAKIKELGIVPVKADWTSQNPEITETLLRFGRVGVPFYVLYPAGKPDAPITLPEILTQSLVLDTLGKAR